MNNTYYCVWMRDKNLTEEPQDDLVGICLTEEDAFRMVEKLKGIQQAWDIYCTKEETDSLGNVL
jgi:hypothetical protein